MGWVLPAAIIASIVAPPVISYVGDQTWNKETAEAQRKAAEAAAFDMQQRKQAGINPYAQTTPAVQTNTTDPMSAMMPMMMMMMMIPLMQKMAFKNGGDE